MQIHMLQTYFSCRCCIFLASKLNLTNMWQFFKELNYAYNMAGGKFELKFFVESELQFVSWSDLHLFCICCLRCHRCLCPHTCIAQYPFVRAAVLDPLYHQHHYKYNRIHPDQFFWMIWTILRFFLPFLDQSLRILNLVKFYKVKGQLKKSISQGTN